MIKKGDVIKVLVPGRASGLVLLCLGSAAFAGARGITDTTSSPYVKLKSVDFDSVRWTEGFWAQRFKKCKEVTLPHLYKLAADPNYGHALTNLRIAAGLEEGEFAGTHWQDAWVYKWLEAAAAAYGVTKDAHLDKLMDGTIDVIAKAQQDDGYIASQITVRGWKRFQNPHHHECYTMGHLITAACIHHRITQKTNFLDVARRTADYLCEQFKGKNPRMAHFPRNPSVVMAAVELYRNTGQQRYLELANTVIDMRGAFPNGSDLSQDRVPLRKEREVVGHAVFYNGEFKLRQETDYPWHGTVHLAVEKAPQDRTINLRIPGWAERAKLLINGKPVRFDVQPGTYACVAHEWSSGDEITLQLSMEARLLVAHPKVEEARNQVAVVRGPIVYCLESVDLPEGVKISDVVIPYDITLRPCFDEQLLGGITVLQGQARVFNEADWLHQLYRELTPQEPKKVAIKLIPYYAWANRGVSEMTVWLPLAR